MVMPSISLRDQAARDFQQARRRAAMEEILARLRGKSAFLLPYDEVRARLGALESPRQKLEDIPIKAIVGSVGRYTDFTRGFLPLKESDRERWVRVRAAMECMEGLPPITVYQIGEAYFVLDGHHRISIARQLGATHIQAYVIQVNSRVPISPEDQPDDIILKSEYADFLAATRFDDLFPGVSLLVSVPGQYARLLEHISVHRYFMGINHKREISMSEAVMSWYQSYYLPIVRLIRRLNILRDFPQRTETDLYLWITEHQNELAEELGWKVTPDAAAQDFLSRFSRRPQRWVQRLAEKIYDFLLPDELESGPAPAEWRMERMRRRPADQIVSSILVPLSGNHDSWNALDVAIDFARREGAYLAGLHVTQPGTDHVSSGIQTLVAEFHERCEKLGVAGDMAVEQGKIATKICERSRWTDLTILKLAHPPPLKLIPRLSSGFRLLIRRCPTPILAVPCPPCGIERILLAFDGSPRANEALFVAVYFAARWDASLVVVSVLHKHLDAGATIQNLKRYLEGQRIRAQYVIGDKNPADLILKTAKEQDCDMIVMGGYSAGPLKELVFGSTVDRVLQATICPVLICK